MRQDNFFIIPHPFTPELLAATAVKYKDFNEASVAARELAKNNLGHVFYVTHAIESCMARIEVVTSRETDATYHKNNHIPASRTT